jgi:zinc transport system permease protein
MIESFFQYEFLNNAILASILASIACGIIGTYIVSKRIVFIAGGITHASFGGIGIGFFMAWNPILSALGFSVIVAWIIQYFSKRTEIREDSVIATLWSLGMAIGILFIYLTPGYAPNLMSYLFGSILTVSSSDLYLMLIVTISLLVFFLFFMRAIIFITFDQDFAQTKTSYVNLFNYLLITFTALVIVVNIRVVGIILVLSLLTIPQNIANIFFFDFKQIMWSSIVISLFGTLGGLAISFAYNIPSGATIIVTLVSIFILAKIYESIRVRFQRKMVVD